MVDVRQVVEDRQVDDEDADLRAADRQNRDDPWDAAGGGPAEPEEADGEEGWAVSLR